MLAWLGERGRIAVVLDTGAVSQGGLTVPILLKVIISGLIISGINLVAQRSPGLAGWLAAFPVMTFLSITWLWSDGRDNAALGHLVTGVLWGLIPTGVLLIVLAVCLRLGLPAFAGMALAVLVWIGFTVAAQRIGVFA